MQNETRLESDLNCLGLYDLYLGDGMGFIEIIYRDGSGLLIQQGKIEAVEYEYCGKCREIKEDRQGDSLELGTFICHTCLGWSDGKPA